MFTLAHLSDLHVTPLAGASPLSFLNKRFFGWLSWNARRGRVHRPEVVEALLEDLKSQAPDHVAVTGDLTNVALEQEFIEAVRWLERLGKPERVSLVPGNHDAYVPIDSGRSWDHWAPFICSDSSSAEPVESPRGSSAVTPLDFPTLRLRGAVALVGVCSALPTAFFRATGRVGSAQLTRIEQTLQQLGERGLFRVVLIHHPPSEVDIAGRRRLVDAASLRGVFRRVGAELILHGHVHRTLWSEIEGPDGPIPVAGVRSASDIGVKEHKRAQYHLFGIEPRCDAGSKSRIHVAIRGYDRAAECFVSEGEQWL